METHGPRYSEEEARAAIAASRSYTEALRRLGMRAAGGNYRTIRRYVEDVWRIPIDHFDPDAVRRAALARPPAPLTDVLVPGSTYQRSLLKERLFGEGLKERRCELCGQDEMWHGRRMSLILDHINGVHDDNRLGNLRIVCANCNATLDTHCGRNNRLPQAQRACLLCGALFFPRTPRHRYCSRTCGQRAPGLRRPRPASRRVTRPPYGQLVAEIATLGYTGVGRKYDVSDNAVRKWRHAYEAEADRAAVAETGDRGRVASLAGASRDALPAAATEPERRV